MEVCVDSVLSAQNGEKGGASRIELCANLYEGGTTPSAGMLKIIKRNVRIPVFVMIRPRGGDFCYDGTEVEVMLEDIRVLKDTGADGFVFGALNQDGLVDVNVCKTLLDQAYPKPVTFHRAIDMSKDIYFSLSQVVDLGFSRVLTSGGLASAFEGRDVITKIIQKFGEEIIIVPGGGININNLEAILESGAKEFHGTARESLGSSMKFRKEDVAMGAIPGNEFTTKRTSTNLVSALVKMAESFWKRG